MRISITTGDRPTEDALPEDALPEDAPTEDVLPEHLPQNELPSPQIDASRSPNSFTLAFSNAAAPNSTSELVLGLTGFEGRPVRSFSNATIESSYSPERVTLASTLLSPSSEEDVPEDCGGTSQQFSSPHVDAISPIRSGSNSQRSSPIPNLIDNNDEDSLANNSFANEFQEMMVKYELLHLIDRTEPITTLSLKDFVAMCLQARQMGRETKWEGLNPCLIVPIAEGSTRHYLYFNRIKIMGIQMEAFSSEDGVQSNYKVCVNGCMKRGIRQWIGGTT